MSLLKKVFTASLIAAAFTTLASAVGSILVEPDATHVELELQCYRTLQIFHLLSEKGARGERQMGLCRGAC